MKKGLILLILLFFIIPIRINASTTNPIVSIMGDSISTYGEVTAGNNYYPRSDITNVSNTWWMSFINEKGYRLGYNYSWGGTTLAKRSDSASEKWFYSDTRVNSLAKNGTPDYIFIFGGTNDMNAYPSTPIGSFNNLEDGSTLIGSYSILINKLKTKYPSAKIIAILPMKVPKLTDSQYKPYHDAFEQIFNKYAIPYVDLSKVSGLTLATGCKENNNCEKTYFIDHLHPNKAGANVIKNEIVKLFSKTATVTFNRNYNSSDKVTTTKTYKLGNFNQKFSNNGYSRIGYKQVGWSTDRNSNIKNYNTESNVYDWWIQKNPNITLYAIWEPYIMSIKYHVNGGTVKSFTNSTGIKIGSQNSLITVDGNTSFYTLKYGESLPSTGLSNYNNDDFIKITKSGYSVISGKEWKDKNGKVYSQDYQYKASDFSDICDVSKNSCEVILYVNWKKIVDIPTCSSKTYTGSDQVLFNSHNSSSGYSNDKLIGKDSNNYFVKLSLNDDYIWSDNTTSNKTLTCSINRKKVNIPTCASKVYNGKEQILFNSRDGSVGYTSNTLKGKDVKDYTNTLTLYNDNYEWSDGTTSDKNIICKIEKSNINNASISDISNQKYTGSYITPSINVKLDNITLVKDIDYKVSYTNNINPGTASVTITGINNFTGSKTLYFSIEKDVTSSVTSKDTDYYMVRNNKIFIKFKSGVKKLSKSTLINNLTITGNYDVRDKDNNIITGSSLITTGSKIHFSDKEYEIIILGDINKDGYITMSDVNELYRHIKKTKLLSGNQLEAANYLEDKYIGMSDLYEIYKKIKEKNN